MEVSVVIPTRLRAELLARALESVVRQTLQPELIVVVEDGGYTPATKDVVDRFAARAPIVYLESLGGACAARNAGLSAVSSPLVSFLDDDDWWDETFLLRCVGVLDSSRQGEYALTDRVFLKSDNSTHVSGTPELTVFGEFLQNAGFGGTNGVFFAEALRLIGGWDEGLTALQDRDLQIRLNSAGYSMVAVREPLAYKDSTHGMTQITYSSERANGSWLFYKKWKSSVPPLIRGKMLLNAVYEQRQARNLFRRATGTFCWQVFTFPSRAVTKLKLMISEQLDV